VLDLRLLHQALTLARHRNFARAAEALHMTQPALSRSIAGLEAGLGEKLFSRTRQGVEPTSFGQMLLSRGQELLAAATELERDFALLRGLDIGELRVGAGAYPAEMSVGRAAGQLAGRHPGLRIELMVADLRALAAAVIDRRLDVAVIELSLVDGEPRIATEALPRHAGHFYCRAGHPLVAETAPAVERILAFPFAGTRMPRRVAESFLRIARAGAIDPDSGDYLPPIKVDSVELTRDIVLRSDAVGVAPLSMLSKEIESGRLVALPTRLPWMTTAYGFVYLRDRLLSPAAEAFMAEVRRVEDERVAESAALASRLVPDRRDATPARRPRGRSRAAARGG
jgi:DNA-binding transcriptional LysR family regulator